jgi:ankyrin repeat protein
METNGSPFPDQKTNGAAEKLLPSSENKDEGDGSPVIKIRNPGKWSRSSYRSNSIRLKRFDLISEDFTPHEAAKEGRLKILKDLKESGESLEERDCKGFSPIHHAVRANQSLVIEYLLDSGVDANTKGGKNEITPLHVSVR